MIIIVDLVFSSVSAIRIWDGTRVTKRNYYHETTLEDNIHFEQVSVHLQFVSKRFV